MYKKRIVILVLVAGYFFTSIIFTISLIYSNNLEAKFWKFNLLNASILNFLFPFIHIIIKDYSFRQIIEFLHWQKLRKITPLKLIIIGVLLLLIPVIILYYANLFIPNLESSNLLVGTLVIIPMLIGLVLIVKGGFMNGKCEDVPKKDIVVPPISQIAPISTGFAIYIMFFFINTCGFIPIITLILFNIFHIHYLLIVLILTSWFAITLFFLFYFQHRRLHKDLNLKNK